jgi:hypothetical protein
MYENIWLDAAILLGAMHLIVPVIVRSGFRFASRCEPVAVPVNELPHEVAAYIVPRIPEMQNLAFELLGCYDLGMLTSNTQRYVAYFLKRSTNDFRQCDGSHLAAEDCRLFRVFDAVFE